jgi:taurine dioxygenase
MSGASEQKFQIRPLAPAVGSEVLGADVGNLDDNGFETIRRTLFVRGVLVIRNQPLTPDAQVEFSKRWGDVFITPHLAPIPGHPEVVPVENRGKAKTVTEAWHSDSVFAKEPPAITMLTAHVLPEVGGDTMFSSQYEAYDRLSPGMKKLAESIDVAYRSTVLANLAGGEQTVTGAVHPAVLVHPETGRKALYMTCVQAAVIQGMNPEENRAIINLFQNYVAPPDIVYRHRWQPGDLVMWDNRCTQHYAVHDHGDAERLLHRTTIVCRKKRA